MQRHRRLVLFGRMAMVALLVAALAIAVVPRSARSTRTTRKSALSGRMSAQLKFILDGHPNHPEPFEDVKAWYNWFYGQRMAPGKSLPKGALAAARSQAKLLSKTHTLGGVAAWQPLGPQPINSADSTYADPYVSNFGAGWTWNAGRSSAVVTKPGDPNVVYAGFADGGVWKSTNGGKNWTQIGLGDLDTLAIGALAVDPNHPDRLWVGTGEANTAFENYYGDGIYVSNNGGASFTHLGASTFVRTSIQKIAISPDSSTVLVATLDGLYRSTDNGTSWDLALAPGGTADQFGNDVTDVAYLPGTADHVLAAVGWRSGDALNGLYLSTNDGADYTELGPGGLPAVQHVGRMSFAVTADQPGLIYLILQDPFMLNAGRPTNLNGIWRSLSGPEGPWDKVAGSKELASDPNSALMVNKIGPGYQPGVQAWYNQHVEIAPGHPETVVVGLEELYQSTNYGDDWDTIGRYWNYCFYSQDLPNCDHGPYDETTHPDQHAGWYTTVNGHPRLYVGNDGGIYRQDGLDLDNSSWINLNKNDLNTSQSYYAAGALTAGGKLIAYSGTQDNGSNKYVGGKTWPQVQGGDGGDVAVYPNDPEKVFTEYVDLSIFASSDGGQTWHLAYTPDSGSGATARFIAPFDLDPLDKTHLVALGQHVWESTKGVDTHTGDYSDLCDDNGNACDMGAGHIGTALGVRGDTIYAGYCGPCNPGGTFTGDPVAPFSTGLYTNHGGTWHQAAGGGLPNRYITSVTIDPSDGSHIYLSLSAFSRHWTPSAGYGHVYESTDSGESFTDISGNLPDAPSNDTLLYHGRLFTATDVGIFEMTTPGVWAVVGTGLPPASTLDISMVPGTNTMLAATHGMGVWRIQV